MTRLEVSPSGAWFLFVAGESTWLFDHEGNSKKSDWQRQVAWATVGDDGSVAVCLGGESILHRPQRPDVKLSGCPAAFAPDAPIVAIGRNGTTELWDVSKDQPAPIRTDLPGGMHVRFARKASRLVIWADELVDQPDTVHVWEAGREGWASASSHRSFRVYSPLSPEDVEISEDGRFALTRDRDKLHLWDLELGDEAWVLDAEQQMTAVAVFGQTKQVAYSTTQEIRVEACPLCVAPEELIKIARERIAPAAPRELPALDVCHRSSD